LINGHTTQITNLNTTSTTIFNNLNSLSTNSTLSINNLNATSTSIFNKTNFSYLVVSNSSTLLSSLNIAGTLTGTTINALTNLQEEGISLSSKYFQLSTFIANATEKQYPPSVYNSFTASTATTGELTSIIPTTFIKKPYQILVVVFILYMLPLKMVGHLVYI
jgi:hypothetical protein